MSARTGRAALVLVDLQADYLDAPTLEPAREVVVARAADLLTRARRAGAPIVHVHTEVQHMGANAMPHRRAQPKCVAGTPGAEPPSELAPLPDEARFTKQFYSPFSNPSFGPWLIAQGIDTVVIAGAYTHACVRQTAVDAYERGYRVVIVEDACASSEPEHATASLDWMSARFVTRLTAAEAAASLAADRGSGDRDAVAQTVSAAAQAQREWAARPLGDRVAALASWRDAIEKRRSDLEQAIVRDVAKPIRFARDEVARALAHIDEAIRVCTESALGVQSLGGGVTAHRAPRGVIAALMPWNNPVALPVSNIAPALLCGNAVVLKPSPHAPESTALLLATVASALPTGVVAAVPSDLDSSRALIRQPEIAAVALTGSIATGRELARSCAERMIPLRAELGGNNAAIVWGVADIERVARDAVLNAFAFAGQRCTAIRRLIVQRSELDRTREALGAAMAAVAVGAPEDESTVCGPLVSIAAAARVRSALAEAEARGARVVSSGANASDDARWVPPTLAVLTDPHDPLVQTESFGPVLVVQPADTLEQAIELANGVEQGLVLAVASDSANVVDQVVQHAQVGMVQRGLAPLPVHPAAPFTGWKASGFGGAEHGVWDLEFFTRPQARYGLDG